MTIYLSLDGVVGMADGGASPPGLAAVPLASGLNWSSLLMARWGELRKEGREMYIRQYHNIQLL